MKKGYFALSAGAAALAAVLIAAPGLAGADEQTAEPSPAPEAEEKQESEEVLTLTQQEGVVTFSESEEGNRLTLYDMKLELPAGMVMDTGVTEEGTAFAFASAGGLRLMLSAGESALLEGTLSEMTEEAREAYRIYTDFDVEKMYLIDSALTEIGDQVFVMNSYYEETEKSAVILLNTVVDGISYSVSGYTAGELPEDEDLEIIMALAAALEVDD